jgi:putative tryptophan/tyrosine transport system substrate-binding protein
MNRRAVLGLLGCAATAWPLAARAQSRTPRLGILLLGDAVLGRELEIAHELARIGYIDGRNVTYEVRGSGGDPSRLPQLARELAATKPDAIVSASSPAALALIAATRDIPIVMTAIGDPVALGLTDSMSRPSRNVTGFTISSLSLAAKRLEILHAIVPALRKVAYLWAPENPLEVLFEEQVRKAADMLGITLVSLPLSSDADIASAFRHADEEQVAAVLVEADFLTLRFNGSIVNECLLRDLPAMHSWPIEVRNGALMSYGPAEMENFPRAAVFIDRIFKGAKVAELPFEEPTEIKLVINLRTARAIGLVVPPTVLARADEVIE